MSAVLDRKKYTGTAQRIMNFMGAGMIAEQAAEACAVDPSFVSQLWAEQEFKDQVADLRLKGTSDLLEIDQAYIRIEKLSIKRLEMLAQAITDPLKLIHLAKFANEAKRKAPMRPGQDDGSDPAKVVKLSMPIAITNQFVLNPNKEVVELDGKALVTMTPKMLESKLTERLPPPEGKKNGQVIESL